VGFGLYGGHATLTGRVDSQHDGYLSLTLTVRETHTAWTISKSLGLRGCVGQHVGGVLNDHAQTCAAAAESAIVT